MRCSGWSSLAISACRGGTCPALASTKGRTGPAPTRRSSIGRRRSGIRPTLVGAIALAALLLAAPVGAHIVATPAFLPSESSRSIDLAGPNERDDPMTGFRVTAPDGLVIAHAHDVDGWTATFDDSSAEWSGGSLAPDEEEIFGITLKAESEPDVLELSAEQLYADGAVVSWPVDVTVTPAEESPSQNLALAAVIGLIGVLVVVAVAMVAWRRREPPSATA